MWVFSTPYRLPGPHVLHLMLLLLLLLMLASNPVLLADQAYW